MIPKEIHKEIQEGCIEETNSESWAKQQGPGPCDSWFGKTELAQFCKGCAKEHAAEFEGRKEAEEFCLVALDTPSACLEVFADDELAAHDCSRCAHFELEDHEGLEDAAWECIETASSYAKSERVTSSFARRP